MGIILGKFNLQISTKAYNTLDFPIPWGPESVVIENHFELKIMKHHIARILLKQNQFVLLLKDEIDNCNTNLNVSYISI